MAALEAVNRSQDFGELQVALEKAEIGPSSDEERRLISAIDWMLIVLIGSLQESL